MATNPIRIAGGRRVTNGSDSGNPLWSGTGVWSMGQVRALKSVFCQALDLILLGGTFLGIVVAPYVSEASGSFQELLAMRVSLQNIVVGVLCISTWRVILMSVSLYSRVRTRTVKDYFLRFFIGLNACTALVGFLQVVMARTAELWHMLVVFWVASLALLFTSRMVLVVLEALVRPLLRRKRNLLIVGTGARAKRVVDEMGFHGEWEYSLVGFLDSDPQEGFVPREMLLGGIDRLEQLLMHTVVDEVVIALPMKSQYAVISDAITTCQMLGIPAQYFTDYFGTEVTKRRLSAGPGSGRVLLEVVFDDYRLLMKRIIDIVVSLSALIVLSPVMLAVAIAVKVTSPGPILFKQKRYGLNKRTFSMLKFRSMYVDAEARQAAVEHLNETTGPAFKIKNDPRVTSIGPFIRKMSLDELPQLFNVLMGSMSLVGPRPLPMRDVSKFSDAWLMRRFSVKPGITCLWQIGGRSNTDFDRWIELDLEYIDHWSLGLDFEILLKTPAAVLTSRGAA